MTHKLHSRRKSHSRRHRKSASVIIVPVSRPRKVLNSISSLFHRKSSFGKRHTRKHRSSKMMRSLRKLFRRRGSKSGRKHTRKHTRKHKKSSKKVSRMMRSLRKLFHIKSRK